MFDYFRNIFIRSKNKMFVLFLCLTQITFLIFPVSSIHAETEVSGEVSGTWDLDGSPYLVIDTLFVPEGDTLQIDPGVTVEFQDQNDTLAYPILVAGVFLAEGEEGDSVYILSEEFPFSGIHQATLDDSPIIILEYIVLNGAISAVKTTSATVSISRSRIHAEACLNARETTVATMEYCNLFHLENDPLERALVIMFGMGQYQFQNNTGLTTELDLHALNNMEIYGNTINFCNIDTYSEITIHDNIFQRLDCEGYLNSRGTYYVYNNTIVGEPYDHGILSYQADLTVHHNTANGLHLQHFSFAEVDSNIFIGETHVARPGVISLNSSGASISRNLVVSPTRAIDINSTGDFEIEIVNNTLSFGETGIRLSELEDDFCYIANNILLGDGVNCIGVNRYDGDNPDILQYNCFHDVSAIALGLDIDETNIIANPQLAGGNPFDYHLQANSPCIDAADPDSPDEPDGTPADMGCYFYDQSIDNPPVLTSPTYLYGTSMGEFSYTARATDDNGILTFHFEGIPDNWEIDPDDLDWVADSAVVEGILPDDEGILSFGVWVEDGLGQTDTSEVLVEVRDYTILQGEISGTLSSELSPYYVVHDLIVPAGDSLVIEPGCELLFRYEEYEDYRLRLTCYGTLIAEGTEDDSIRFSMDEDEAVNGGWNGIRIIGNTDTSSFQFSRFDYGYYSVNLDSQAIVEISDSYFPVSYFYTILTNSQSTLMLQSNTFYTDSEIPFSFIRSYDSNINIDSCLLVNENYETNASPDIRSEGSTTIVTNSAFFRTGPVNSEFDSDVRIIRNYLYSTICSESNDSRIYVANNIFKGSDEPYEGGVSTYSPGDTIINNIFIGLNIATTFNDHENGDHFPVIRNNLFLDNDIAIRNRTDLQRDFTVDYNCFWNNDTLTVDCPIDSTNFLVDPQLADTLFHLYDSSPLIDAGNPEIIYYDIDGTRNDIGLFGGPNGESYEYFVAVYEESGAQPDEFRINGLYPNPFNQYQTVLFGLPKTTDVYFKVYNLLGRVVFSDIYSSIPAGYHSKTIDASNLSSGVYFVELKAGKEVKRVKAILMK